MRRALHALMIVALTALSIAFALSPARASGRPLAIALSPSTVTVTEGQPASFMLSKSGGNGRAVSVKVTAGSWSGYVTPGTSFSIPTVDDSIVNGTRTIVVTALASTGATARATITELDNDVAPAPAPVPAPVSAEPAVANDLTGGTPLADNFNTADGIATNNWITGPSPDSEGNFRMICGAGQVLRDDPIVYPGQSGKSHLHQFFGNLGANANSTYQSLRSTGGSTCGDPTSAAPVNRSGYWMPAMLDGAGNVVKPEYVAIYYKREPSSGPECTPGNAAFIGTCVGIPTGLRFITGYNMTAGNMGDAHPFYYCQDSDMGGAKAVNSSLQSDMPSVIPLCPASARLTLNIAGPDCWDGKNLDTADHRSHVAHGGYVFDPTTNSSHYRCDPGHPYHIPQMSIMAFYVTDANFAAGKWHLSSDEMVPGAVPGSTFHTDYWEAWSPTVRQTWGQYCTDGHLQCAGGDLGNGTRIKGMTVPNTAALVPLTSIP